MMGKRSEHFIKEEIQVANKFKKRCSNSLLERQMQTKTIKDTMTHTPKWLKEIFFNWQTTTGKDVE